jgi:hypothetical protein
VPLLVTIAEAPWWRASATVGLGGLARVGSRSLGSLRQGDLTMTRTGNRAKAKTRPPAFRLRRRTRRLLGWGVLAACLAIVGAVVYQWAANLPGSPVPSLGNDHLQSADEPHAPYNSDPPTSGPHLGYLAPWGIHTAPIPKELQVHNLEDGGVAVQYNCPRGCPELIQELTAIVRRYDRQVILVPYPGMDTTIALTAWGRIDKFEALDEKRIVRFIEAYRGIDHHARNVFQR